jgi:hypothetical protein
MLAAAPFTSNDGALHCWRPTKGRLGNAFLSSWHFVQCSHIDVASLLCSSTPGDVEMLCTAAPLTAAIEQRTKVVLHLWQAVLMLLV